MTPLFKAIGAQQALNLFAGIEKKKDSGLELLFNLMVDQQPRSIFGNQPFVNTSRIGIRNQRKDIKDLKVKF